jgi:hypothetical protein
MPSPEISPELEELIIRRLADTANRNKVIEELCLERGIHWQDAGQIVDDIVQSHQLDITRQQSPFLALAALSIFIGGVLLVAWNLLGIYNYLWPYFDPNTPDALGLYLFSSDAFQAMLNTRLATPLFVTGLAMIVGSCFGMKDVWVSFFEWLDQWQVFSFSINWSTVLDGVSSRESQTHPDAEASIESDFVPSEEVKEYVFDQLEKGQNEAQVVEALWLKFAIEKHQGVRIVRRIFSASGKEFSGKTTMAFALVALAAFFAGLVWVFQFIYLLSRYMDGIPRPFENAWHLILRLSDTARYIERFPVVFGLFAVGLVFVVGGVYGLKDLLPSIFLLKRKVS